MKKLTILIVIAALMLTTTCLVSFAEDLQVINAAILIGDQANDFKNWEGTWIATPERKSQVEFTSDSISMFGRDIKSVGYMNLNVQNFRFDYKLKITWPEDAYDWGSVVTFRDQHTGWHVWEQGRSETYGIMYKLDVNVDDVAKAGIISIAKWNQPATRNVDPENLGEKAQISGLDLSGKEYVYNLFVEDIPDGVHFMLYMDGKLIIDCTDTGTKLNGKQSPPIMKAGGFSVLQDAPRTLVFSGVKPDEQPVLQTPSPSASSTAPSQEPSPSGEASVNQPGSTNATSTESPSNGETSSTTPEAPASSETPAETSSAAPSPEVSTPPAETQQSPSTEAATNNDSLPASSETPANSDSTTMMIIIISVVVILGLGAVAALIIVRRKKK